MCSLLNKDIPWVLVEINNTIYAVSCNMVLSLSQLPAITPLPATPNEIRGVVIFRGKSVQLLDSRILLGFKAMSKEVEEFVAMMDLRYQDHLNWINTLQRDITNGNEFTLTVDPHKCAFGKWYDSYETKNTNIMFLSTFAKFDEPHKAIHKIGVTAQELIKKGQKDKAIALIESAKDNELKQMLHLFEDLKEAFKDGRKEIMMVLGADESRSLALSVDQIISIEHLSEFDENLIKDSITDTKYLSGLAKRKNGSVVFILNEEYLFSKYN